MKTIPKHRYLRRFLLSLLCNTRHVATIVMALFCVDFVSVAQNLDLLERVVEYKSIPVEEKNRIYDDLSWGYSTIDYFKTVCYSQKGIELAEQQKEEKMVATCLLNMGIVYCTSSRHNTVETYLAKDLQTANSIKDVNFQSALYGVYGNLYNVQGDCKMALDNYMKSISETKVQYETEKKEAQISALLKQKRLYGIITVTTITVILLLLLIVYLRYRIVKQRKLIVEQKVINLEHEKKLIATQSILEGENAERTRLARDLHDGLGGMLSLVKLKLYNVKGNMVVPQSELPLFQNAMETLDQAIRELRHVAHNLMPESLMHEGLKAALTDFCNDIPQAEIQFFGSEQGLEESYRITSFRILQELVTNALKHADATQITVQVIIDNDRLDLIVADNGRGFDIANTDLSVTSGLNNLRSRAEFLGGRMTVQSEPNKGTEVEIEFIFNDK